MRSNGGFCMFAKISSRQISTAILILFVSLVAWPSEATAKKKKAMPKGERVLWLAPADIGSRDLFLGPGGAAMKPNLRRVKFIKEETGGYSKKYRIRDASGRIWVAKVGKEAQSETAAVRLLWAAGYVTEINYLVPRLRIPGQGTFENVRLEARPASQKRLDEWKWDENPFVGSREFAGLKTMMVLFNNWDIKDSNNVVVLATARREMSSAMSSAISAPPLARPARCQSFGASRAAATSRKITKRRSSSKAFAITAW
jgi:hypothetical protein